MVSPKQLTLLAAAGVAASLFLAQPARALTAIAQPYLISIDQARVDAVQPIGHGRWHDYRGTKCDYRHDRSRLYCRPQQKFGYHRRQQKSGYYKPWTGHEPCANCPSVR